MIHGSMIISQTTTFFFLRYSDITSTPPSLCSLYTKKSRLGMGVTWSPLSSSASPCTCTEFWVWFYWSQQFCFCILLLCSDGRTKSLPLYCCLPTGLWVSHSGPLSVWLCKPLCCIWWPSPLDVLSIFRLTKMSNWGGLATPATS